MRRRRYVLLLALVPIALAVTTLAVVTASGLHGDPAGILRDIGKPSRTAPEPDAADQTRNDNGAARSGAAVGIPSSSVPAHEPSEPPDVEAPPTSRPAVAPDSGEVYGRPRVAMAPMSENTVGAEPYRSPLRMANLSGGSGPSGAAYKSTGSPGAGPSGGTPAAGGNRSVGDRSTREEPERSGGVPGDARTDPTARDAENTPTGSAPPGAGRDMNVAPVVPGFPERPVVRVPEPGSLALMLLALLGYAAHRGLRR